MNEKELTNLLIHSPFITEVDIRAGYITIYGAERRELLTVNADTEPGIIVAELFEIIHRFGYNMGRKAKETEIKEALGI